MKLIAFASRNWKELIRDKLNLIFGIGFPVILLLLFSLGQQVVYFIQTVYSELMYRK